MRAMTQPTAATRPPMTAPAILTRDLTKRYGTTTGIEGLDLEVPAGTVFGYPGPSGGGIDPARITDLAARHDLDLERRVGDLSSGNRQKVGVLQAFMHDPEVLVLDEPTSGLDPLMQRAFLALLREAGTPPR